jgi:hypothetical protein
MLTSAPSNNSVSDSGPGPCIEVIGSTTTDTGEDDNSEKHLETVTRDFERLCVAGGTGDDCPPEFLLQSTAKPRYGFNDSFVGFLGKFQPEFPELVQIPEPDKTPANQRAGE